MFGFENFSESLIADIAATDRENSSAPGFCLCALSPDPRACQRRRARSTRSRARPRRRRSRVHRGRSAEPSDSDGPPTSPNPQAVPRAPPVARTPPHVRNASQQGRRPGTNLEPLPSRRSCCGQSAAGCRPTFPMEKRRSVRGRTARRRPRQWTVMFRSPDGRVRGLSRFAPVPFASRQEAQVEAWKQARKRNATVTFSDFVEGGERMGSPT